MAKCVSMNIRKLNRHVIKILKSYTLLKTNKYNFQFDYIALLNAHQCRKLVISNQASKWFDRDTEPEPGLTMGLTHSERECCGE